MGPADIVPQPNLGIYRCCALGYFALVPSHAMLADASTLALSASRAAPFVDADGPALAIDADASEPPVEADRHGLARQTGRSAENILN